MYKLAICITTFLRDNLLYKTLDSIKEFPIKEAIILIADQGYRNEEKSITYDYYRSLFNLEIDYLPFDCGLSAGRNFLIKKASDMQIPYCLISADSIQFDMHCDFEIIYRFLETDDSYGLVGFNLKNSKCNWEYKMHLDKKGIHFIESDEFVTFEQMSFKRVDIMRNIFIAKTDAIKNLYNENFKLCEHELSFIELQKRGIKSFWTDRFSFKKANSMGTEEYKTYRNRFGEYQKKLKKYLNIKNWVIYDNPKKGEK